MNENSSVRLKGDAWAAQVKKILALEPRRAEARIVWTRVCGNRVQIGGENHKRQDETCKFRFPRALDPVPLR